MECNKEEARRAVYIAEKKISENDYDGAKRFVNKAQRLYPQLDGLKQVLMMIDVYISASNREADWYGILGVDPLADDEAVKKSYKKLALLLHPDKNRFSGAEGAFKLVLEAWNLLSDKARRTAYDQKRKSKQVKQKTTKPNESEEQNKDHAAAARGNANSTHEAERRQTSKPNEPEREPDSSLKRWFEENKKKLDAAIAAAAAAAAARGNANSFTNIKTERLSKNPKTNSTTFEAERLSKKPATNSTHEAERSQTSKPNEPEREADSWKRWLEENNKKLDAAVAAAAARGNANSFTNMKAERLSKNPTTNSTTLEEERLSKKPATNSTFEEESLSKNPMTSGDANSTHEAERLFKNPMKKVYANSTHEAQWLFGTRWQM